MSWKTITPPPGSKLFQVHHFTFMHNGDTFLLEIDEFSDGNFSGHGEHSIDKSHMVESVSGESISECISQLIAKITAKE